MCRPHPGQPLTRASPRWDAGRCTAPVLFDKKVRSCFLQRAAHGAEQVDALTPHTTRNFGSQTMKIVSNESKDIVRMLCTAAFPGAHAVDLYPEPLRDEIDRLGEFIYNRINNGTYKSGFATTQQAYDFAQRVRSRSHRPRVALCPPAFVRGADGVWACGSLRSSTARSTKWTPSSPSSASSPATSTLTDARVHACGLV